MWVIGFALNDSGTAIPAVSATLAIPLVIAASITRVWGATAQRQRQPPPPAASQPTYGVTCAAVAERQVVHRGRHARAPGPGT